MNLTLLYIISVTSILVGLFFLLGAPLSAMVLSKDCGNSCPSFYQAFMTQGPLESLFFGLVAFAAGVTLVIYTARKEELRNKN